MIFDVVCIAQLNPTRFHCMIVLRFVVKHILKFFVSKNCKKNFFYYKAKNLFVYTTMLTKQPNICEACIMKLNIVVLRL